MNMLTDRYGRSIRYLRVSLTDRCDFRCVYCMSEKMRFTHRSKLLDFDELERIIRIMAGLGVRKVRLTGGEPLLRRGLTDFCHRLTQIEGITERVLTTNGSHLAFLADDLVRAGIQRINISLDSLQPERFRQISRFGNLDDVLEGIEAACRAGFERIKLNTVILRGVNEDEVLSLLDFALEKKFDISFIEEMPLGEVGRNRPSEYYSSDWIEALIRSHYRCSQPQTGSATDGPSRLLTLDAAPDIRVGLISPHSHNFCAQCNRVRLTAEGRLLLCLGHEDSLDLRALLRAGSSDEEIESALLAQMDLKPERHQFAPDESVSIVRFMNMTGG